MPSPNPTRAGYPRVPVRVAKIEIRIMPRPAKAVDGRCVIG
jgi:hypothetical protein